MERTRADKSSVQCDSERGQRTAGCGVKGVWRFSIYMRGFLKNKLKLFVLNIICWKNLALAFHFIYGISDMDY